LSRCHPQRNPGGVILRGRGESLLHQSETSWRFLTHAGIPLEGKDQASRKRAGGAMIKTLITALVGVILALVAAASSFSENTAGPAGELQLAQLPKKPKAPGTRRKS